MDLTAFFDEFTRRDWQQVEDGTVRFAMVGVGWWTRDRAIPAVATSELCETTVLVSGDRTKAEAVANEAPSARRGITYDEFHDGVAESDYDAVYISTPNALHLPFAETAAELGKHVLCEKPMEVSSDRATAMVEACDRAGVRLMVGYRMQTEPAVRRARDLIRAGLVGEPAFVHGHMAQPLLAMNPDPDQWRLDPDLAGPGTSVTDLGIYPINTARFVFGADPSSVTATMHADREEFDRVPDERATFELAFEDGVLAACSASQNAQRGGRFEVVGTEGRLTLEPAFMADDRRRLTVERGDTTADFAFETVDQMTEEFDYFADRILGGGPITPDGAHGAVDIRTIEAIYEAAETGERVDL